MKALLLAAAAIAAILPSAAAAQSSDSGSLIPDMGEFRGTIGVRFWRTDWTSWFGQDRYIHADLETTVTPVASLRYKDYLVSGSYMLQKEFKFPLSDNYPKTERREYDINLGYFVLPGLAVSLGYKNIKYEVGDSLYNWEAKGVTVGASGSAPLAPWTSIYANLAYGRPKLTAGGDFNSARGKYLLTELGLAFPLGHLSSAMSGFVVTTGYRYQRIGADRNEGTLSPTGEMFEYTQGPVVGISFSL